MDELDLVVIGAGRSTTPQLRWKSHWHLASQKLISLSPGFSGLAVAKTYLEVNPSAKLLILDTASSVGGVWAKERLYPGLKSNNLLGTYEFSDFPMDPENFGIKPGQHIPGEIVHKYLASYAERFDLVSRIRFETKVQSAEHKSDGGWVLKTAKGDDIATKKLVIATGLTSDPCIPAFVGSDTFGAPLFHMRNFKDNEDTLKTTKNVVVFGGAKSGWDAVYAYASTGIQVDWVIRGEQGPIVCSRCMTNPSAESGRGPIWMAVSIHTLT
jgi:cation diffusion facilitator CzcD-associated flavoprotein CzcO